MGGANLRAFIVSAIAVSAAHIVAQETLSQDDLPRADAAVRAAFAFLYQLPSDMAAASMGSWVLDTGATTASSDRSGQWRIVVTKLTDTGQDLKLEELVGQPGTSPAQLAANMVAMSQLEAKISKAETDASLEVVITVNARESAARDAGDVPYTNVDVPGAQVARHTKGHWRRVEDRELGISVARWSPATLVVKFASDRKAGIQTVGVSAQGSDEMIERVVKEGLWDALAGLVR